MKKLYATLAVIALVAASLAFGAGAASATPGKSKACSGCHGSTTAVKISVTKTSSTSTKVKYRIKVTGGRGTAGWAVFVGGKNVARKTSSTGTFTVGVGKKVKVWAVKTGSGARSKSFTAKR